MLFSKLVRKAGCMFHPKVTIRNGNAYISGMRVDDDKPMLAKGYVVQVPLWGERTAWVSYPDAIKIVRTTKQQVKLEPHVQDLLDASRDARA